MKDSATNITLAVGCVVTALTLGTTCFLTVNAVLAYVRGDTHSIVRDERNEEPIVPAVFASRNLAAAALPDTPYSVVRANLNDSAPHRTTGMMKPTAAYGLAPRQVPSSPTEAPSTSNPEPASVGATAESPPLRQEQARIPDEQVAREEVAVVMSSTALAQCGEGSLGSAICRETARWSICHPESWNKTPECTVQQFEVFMQ